jgi:hypothetical protein
MLVGLCSATTYNDTQMKEALAIGKMTGAYTALAVQSKTLYSFGALDYVTYLNQMQSCVSAIQIYNNYVKAHWPDDPTVPLIPLP